MGVSTGGAFLPKANYDRTSSADSNGTYVNAVNNNAPVVVTGTTFTPTAALHDSRLVTLKNVAGCTITLPPATGSGARFQFIIGLTLTSSSLIVQAANANDYMRGEAYTFVTTTASTFGTANTGTVSTESDTFTFNRTTTGLGTIGDYIEMIDIAANIWSVEADYASSGTAATPFSAAVQALADNTILNLGSGGDTIATDDVGGVKYQRGKRSLGPDGIAADATTTYHAVAGAGTNAVNIKNAAAHLWSVHIFSNAAYPVYVKLFNKASAPSPGSDTPRCTIGVQAGLSRDVSFDPADFATGLGIAITKLMADNDTTAVLSGDCVVDVEYV